MRLRIDHDELEPWKRGLERLVLDAAECAITVDGLDEPVTGTLASAETDEGLMAISRDADGHTGEVVWIPAGRVVAIRAPFEVRPDPAD